MSVRAHLEQVEKSRGTPPEELQLPEFPTIASHVWENFHDIHAGRRVNGMGPSPISHGDILDWCNLRRMWLSSWEIDTILRLGRLWVDVMSEEKNG